RAHRCLRSFPTRRSSDLSTEGGQEPVWARNARELFYRNGGKMMVANVTTQPSFTAAKPKMLFEGYYAGEYDVAPDGQRFVMIKPDRKSTRLNSSHVSISY